MYSATEMSVLLANKHIFALVICCGATDNLAQCMIKFRLIILTHMYTA